MKVHIDFSSCITTPKGIRIPVTSVKGRCPRPLDDGGKLTISIVLPLFGDCQYNGMSFLLGRKIQF